MPEQKQAQLISAHPSIYRAKDGGSNDLLSSGSSEKENKIGESMIGVPVRSPNTSDMIDRGRSETVQAHSEVNVSHNAN